MFACCASRQLNGTEMHVESHEARIAVDVVSTCAFTYGSSLPVRMDTCVFLTQAFVPDQECAMLRHGFSPLVPQCAPQEDSFTMCTERPEDVLVEDVCGREKRDGVRTQRPGQPLSSSLARRVRVQSPTASCLLSSCTWPRSSRSLQRPLAPMEQTGDGGTTVLGDAALDKSQWCNQPVSLYLRVLV